MYYKQVVPSYFARLCSFITITQSLVKSMWTPIHKALLADPLALLLSAATDRNADQAFQTTIVLAQKFLLTAQEVLIDGV